MISNTMIITNDVGLHARPATLFAKAAQKYSSTITVSCNGKSANAKSLLSVLTLGAVKDSEITISADGEDSKAALVELQDLVQNNFGE